MITKIFVTILFSFAVIFTAQAQDIRSDPLIFQPDPDSPILSRDPSLTGEGEAFDFLIGDWDVVITWEPEGSPKDRYRAKWYNHWIIDGHAVMQEWRGPSLTGTEIRFYDKATQSWVGQNIYVNGAWRETKAKSDGDNMVVTIFGKSEARGDFLNRETYFNIKENSFEMKSNLSLDNGVTWKSGDYHMVVTRSVDK